VRPSAQLSLVLLPALLIPLLLGATAKEVDDGIDVYFRDADLGALADQALPVYPDVEAGESKLLERDFPDAPPQISHTVEDMYPITMGDNECLNCHHPENTTGKEDAPLPETHFERAVMARGKKGEPMVWVVANYETAKDVVGNRYNCSMCHTPQATNVRTPENSFERVKAPK
jgi:nitrate reductase cytochrome c-type subunit